MEESRFLLKEEKEVRIAIITDGTREGTQVIDADSGARIANCVEATIHLTPFTCEATIKLLEIGLSEEKGTRVKGTFTMVSKDMTEVAEKN